MEVVVVRLLEGFLDEVFRDVFTSMPSITGPLRDSTTVAIPTFIAGVIAGPVGAVLGAFFGSSILGISKAKGHGLYKPLMQALKEDFTEEERRDLYSRMWVKLEAYVTSPLTQRVIYTAVSELARTVQTNPELVDNIREEINRTLQTKKMVLG